MWRAARSPMLNRIETPPCVSRDNARQDELGRIAGVLAVHSRRAAFAIASKP
jgi:hypothetical protein